MSICIFLFLCNNIYGDYLMIKEKRKLKNYTQENMAELLNISLRQYVRIDKEEDLPRRDVLKNLIIMLDLTDKEIGEYIRCIVNNKYA